MLFTMSFYQLITKDETSASSNVSAAHDVAVGLAEEVTGRKLVLAEYTEACMLHDGPGQVWRVYPSAYPITAVSSENCTVDRMARSILVPTPTWDFIVETTVTSRFREVVYTGGYTVATCPTGLAAILASLTAAIITNGIPVSETPPGATTARVGDVSVSYGPAGVLVEQLVPGACDALAGWRKQT